MAVGKLFIIDLMPFLYRGHFVFMRSPRLTTTGINTSALLGFANGVTAILKDQQPTHVVLAMDPQSPTFRHEAYPPYKAQRQKMPEDLAASIPYAFELAEALNIPVVRAEGFEADDVMGTLAVKAAAQGFEVYLATPDKDAAQLVDENIYLYRPARAGGDPEIYDVEGVKKNWNLTSPAQMIDWLAMAGDSSDNIPGIRGIGEKTASTLLEQYGSLEEVIAHHGELKGKLSEKVANGVEDAKMSKFLTTIRKDVPVEFDAQRFICKEPDAEKLRNVCAKFELFNLAKRFLNEEDVSSVQQEFKTIADTPHEYKLVRTEEEARELAALLAAAPRISFDTETTGVNAWKSELVGMSFSTELGKAWYVVVPPYDKPDDNFGDLFTLAGSSQEAAMQRVGIFAKVFADSSKILVAQNAKFDMTVLGRYGIKFGSTVHDTMLEHYVVDATARRNMDAMAREFLGYDPIPIEKLIGEKTRGGEPQRSMGDLKPEDICDYAAEDADVTLQLDGILRKRAEDAGVLKALEESEEPLVPILIEMEKVGVKIDENALHSFGLQLDKEISNMAAAIKSYGDLEMNLDSPRQLGEFLFSKLGLPGGKKTSTGQFATDEKTLQKIVNEHPVVRNILEYRTCTKLKSTYADKLPMCIDLADGRVHTTFAQSMTETGRLSSSDPNLQNIPVRTERGKMIRAAIVARDENHVLISADYSQVELRLMAAMSCDETMIEAFKNGADIHRETASKVFNVLPELVTDDMRAKCKMVNFGIIYGISAFGLSQRLMISRREAADLITAYFEHYPTIKKFMETSIAKARECGYAVTMLGRRRVLRDINSRNVTVRQSAERDAINTPVQGTAADLIKLAMVKVDRALKVAGLKTKMILQIHDELLFDVPLEEVEKVKEIVKREMEGAMDIGIPLEVGIGVGKNWLEAH